MRKIYFGDHSRFAVAREDGLWKVWDAEGHKRAQLVGVADSQAEVLAKVGYGCCPKCQQIVDLDNWLTDEESCDGCLMQAED
jgi:hypothetical protein